MIVAAVKLDKLPNNIYIVFIFGLLQFRFFPDIKATEAQF